MLDHTAVFLAGAGKETGHVDKGKDRDFERIAKAHETRSFAGAVDIEAARENHGLVCHNAHGLTFQTHEACKDILGIIGLDLVKITLVGDFEDQLFHVIGLVRVVRDQRVEAFFDTRHIVKERPHGGLFAIVERQEIHQAAHLGKGFDVVLEGPVGHGRFLGMG